MNTPSYKTNVEVHQQCIEKPPADEGARKARRAVCRKCGAQAYFTDEFPETCSFCGGELEYRKP